MSVIQDLLKDKQKELLSKLEESSHIPHCTGQGDHTEFSWRKFLETILPKKYGIDNDYKATLEDNVLSLYIPEKLPYLKNRSSYAHKQIILNIAEITKPYERLFYDKFVIVVIKIFEKRKVWDVDNRTVKPIQDGLIHGGVIHT